VNPRALWATAQRWYASHSVRDRRIVMGVGFAALASFVYLGVVDPVLAYRKHVDEEISDGLEELERSARFLAAADSLRAEREQLHKRLEEEKSRLLPGDSGTLGAAALQERANAIAAAKGITVQSTQVMREEPADPFRKVSVRLTISGELKPFADFLASLEYGPQQLNLPFVEVSRRGAVAGAKGPRTLSATVEVSGFLRGTPEKEGKPEEAPAADVEPPANEGEAALVPGEGEGGPNAKAAPGLLVPDGATPPAVGPDAVPPTPGADAGGAPPVAPAPVAGAPEAALAPPPGTPAPAVPGVPAAPPPDTQANVVAPPPVPASPPTTQPAPAPVPKLPALPAPAPPAREDD
jgi:type II secretory pathway component PulM